LIPKLKDLAQKYSSDKLYWHSYIPMYEALFHQRQVFRLLEIGIGFKDLMVPFLPAGVEYCHGSSLKMWAEYFPEADIFACDIREDALINEGRIRSITCDHGSAQQLTELVTWAGGDFDVIIDDGSHQTEHQIMTASLLLPWVKPGGVYVIEDVWPEPGEQMATNFGGILLRGLLGRDDNMVVIQR